MTQIIKNRQAVADEYSIIKLAEGDTPEAVALPAGAVLVPLSVWTTRKTELLARGTRVGVWLDAGEGPEALAADLDQLPVIGVNFPKFVDGRGYTTARLLRERHGYHGEIRAIGDVLQDQLFLMARCGFDAFALKEGKDIAKAVNAFETFKTPYQAAVDQPNPLFRRRAA
ncbi:MAG: DUF934 domain-containing protein [Rhodocyclaceae bacterium]